MVILHTADWHIGQLFHDYDRTYEHHPFLEWPVGTFRIEKADVLLIRGDVIDQSNSSTALVKMFYFFVNKAMKTNPNFTSENWFPNNKKISCFWVPIRSGFPLLSFTPGNQLTNRKNKSQI